jgi:formylglycine-generating enzyme required for sulfatase activity
MTPDQAESTKKIIIWPGDGKEMALIPGGDFVMGSDHHGPIYQPEHQLYVETFYLDRWPVTNLEYKQFVDATDYPVPHYDVSWCNTAGYNWDLGSRSYPPGKENYPVVLVTWEDAMAYATWAKKRLPTEAEWERAARGPNGRLYPWGNEFGCRCNCNCNEVSLGGASPVGHFSPDGDSPEGVMDLVGNVWEWTSTLFRPYPYNPHDGRENPKTAGFRVLRGASWVNDTTLADGLARLDGDFKFYNNVGFRCAADAV